MRRAVLHSVAPWQVLYCLPLPQKQGSLRPGVNAQRPQAFGQAQHGAVLAQQGAMTEASGSPGLALDHPMRINKLCRPERHAATDCEFAGAYCHCPRLQSRPLAETMSNSASPGHKIPVRACFCMEIRLPFRLVSLDKADS